MAEVAPGAVGLLDEVSRQIIEQLQQDGRRPYATIGAAVGLSEAAVRQRVQRLIKCGAIHIVAVANPPQLGFARQAMIGIRLTGNTQQVLAQLTAMTEIDSVMVTAGSFDLLAEAVCVDDAELLDLLNNRIRTLDGVSSTETFVYLSVAKQAYCWGKPLAGQHSA